MKIYLKLPSGAEFHWEREPMSYNSFVTLCVTIWALAVVIGFFSVFIFG